MDPPQLFSFLFSGQRMSKEAEKFRGSQHKQLLIGPTWKLSSQSPAGCGAATISSQVFFSDVLSLIYGVLPPPKPRTPQSTPRNGPQNTRRNELFHAPFSCPAHPSQHLNTLHQDRPISVPRQATHHSLVLNPPSIFSPIPSSPCVSCCYWGSMMSLCLCKKNMFCFGEKVQVLKFEGNVHILHPIPRQIFEV